MIEIRRYLHQHPEISFKEEKTAQYIAGFYVGKDVQIARNVGNGYGIVVTITDYRGQAWENDRLTSRLDNNGVCDDCYSIPLKKSRGLIIT
jgi:hypothetical protein